MIMRRQSCCYLEAIKSLSGTLRVYLGLSGCFHAKW